MGTLVFGIPVTIWANSVALFLPLQDLLSLRLASTHFSASILKVISVYYRRMQWEIQALALDVDYQRKICLILEKNAQAAATLQDLQRKDIYEAKSYCRPPQYMRDTAVVMLLLLEGRLGKDPWALFCKNSYLLVKRFHDLSPFSSHIVQHQAKFEEFLCTVDQVKARYWRPTECFIRTLPHFVAIAKLRSPEFDQKKDWESYAQLQERAAHRFLQRLPEE